MAKKQNNVFLEKLKAIKNLPIGKVLRRVWSVLSPILKIAAGAVGTVALIFCVCGFVFAGILGAYLESDIIPEAYLDLDSFALDKTSFLYYVDANGDIQTMQQVFASTSRKWADYEDIPEDLIAATIAIEDKRFYEHQGVDWFTTIKACANMFFGDSTVGGSSLTQQFIKNYTQEDSITVQRKVLEIFRAVQFEKRYDKEVILEWYLNTIYLGNGCGGVRSAAEYYFGKELEKLTTAECASLISITNNPSIFDPYRAAFSEGGKTGKERNRERQLVVLGEMLAQGWITKEEHTAAVAQELVFKKEIAPEDRLSQCENEACGYKDTVSTFVLKNGKYYCPKCNKETSVTVDASKDMYSWFTEVVLQDVAKALAEKNGMEWNDASEAVLLEQISRSGYHIYTTMDPKVQAQVDKIYTNLSNIPKTYSGQQLQSGIVIVDNSTGDIVALAGGVGQKKDFDAWNRATDSTLQSGSSIKPISIYAPGFNVGAITPATVIKDLPLHYKDGPWPRNDNRKYSYSRTIFSAIVDSVNAVAANTLDKIGIGYSYDFAKNNFGLSTLVERWVDRSGVVHSDRDYAPLAMGAQTDGVTIRDMTCAFATFANNGVYRSGRTFTKVYDSDGKLVLNNTQTKKEVLNKKAVNYTNYCLTQAVRSGTGSGAYISSMNVAGKTGTTSSGRDRWFCGFTKYYTAAVWCGYDIPEVINLVGGSFNPASRLWRNVMQPLHSGKKNVALYSTSDMTQVTVCLDSGKLATAACKADVRTLPGYSSSGFSRVETVYVYKEDAPKEACDKHVLVDFCVSGKGVANEYCKQFAAADSAYTIASKALVKLKDTEIKEIQDAKKYALWPEFYRDYYVYHVDSKGAAVSFKGFAGTANANVDAPYVICPVHTKEAWDAYLAEHPPVVDPDVPSDPTQPGGDTTQPDSGNQTQPTTP